MLKNISSKNVRFHLNTPVEEKTAILKKELEGLSIFDKVFAV
jgi:hypothetical protein